MTSHLTDLTTSIPTGKKAVILFWASWNESSLEPVLTTLANTSPSLFFGKVNAENSPLTDQYQVTMVPTVVTVDEQGNLVQLVAGEDPSAVTQAVVALASSSVVSVPAEQDPEAALTKRLHDLTRAQEVMIFMKGSPDAPKCGFSRQAVEMLKNEQIPFGSFDILQDEQVRQGLKEYSKWPTYPQLYVRGELIGGLDIMKESLEEGNLREQWGIRDVSVAPKSLNERLKELTSRSPVMLFMKGLPSAPKCGFSRQIVEILEKKGVSFDAFDILQDEEVRQGLKTYSDWPTFPQLYSQGALIGGLDIVKELDEDGGLAEALNLA